MSSTMQQNPGAVAQAPRGWWSLVREALSGSEQDYTQGELKQAIFLLAIPMVAEMMMESIFAVVDAKVVSSLGADAMATVGLTESMLSILYSVAMGLGIGAMATVARRIGEKEPDQAARAAVQAVVLGIIAAIPIAVAGILFAKPLLSIMGASTTVVENGYRFTQLMLGGSVTILLLFLINAIFRGAGDAAIAMRVLWLANGINILLAPCLVLGLGPFPKMGVLGAAVATTIGRGAGVVYQLYRLFQGSSRIAIRREHLQVEVKTILSMLKLSGSAIFQILAGTVSWVGLMRILSSFGSEAVAGYTIAIRIALFVLLPSWGMGNAAATLVGQALGAGKPDRAEQAVWQASRYNAWFLGSVSVIFIAAAPQIIALFTHDPAVAAVAVTALRLMASGFLFFAFGMVFTQAFNGAGDTTTPTLLNIGCFWLWEVPLAYVLAKVLGFGPAGAVASIPIAFSTFALVSAILFKRGTWKTRKV